MATGPFHGANLVAFKTLAAEIQTHFAEIDPEISPVKYRFAPRENAYMLGRVRALSAGVAVAAVTEVLLAKDGVSINEGDIVDSGFTLTVEAVPPPEVWYAPTDIHTLKIGFDAA